MMQRIMEPELMDDLEQARVYAEADFAEENQGFVDLFSASCSGWSGGHVIDLGCGPGDIPIRFAQKFPGANVTGVDASRPMIKLAEAAVKHANLEDRIRFRCERFQDVSLQEPADAAISNSLLHHVPNPLQFWYKLTQLVKPGSFVLVMDLLRPESTDEAAAIVAQYAANEPAVLKRDFYNSLLAAFTEDEVAAQLAEMNLSRLLIDVPDDRHWVVGGMIY